MSRKPYLIGIVGGSASGKTSFQRDLAARLAPCAVVSQDDYYRPLEEQSWDASGFANYDLPTAIYRDRLLTDLQKLMSGQGVTGQEFTFQQLDKPGQLLVIDPAPVVVVEGLFLFHCEEIRVLFDLRVFIEAPEDIRKQRRFERDVRERGSPRAHVEYQWENHVVPAYRQYVLPYREQAHVIVTNHDGYAEGLEIVTQKCKAIILA